MDFGHQEFETSPKTQWSSRLFLSPGLTSTYHDPETKMVQGTYQDDGGSDTLDEETLKNGNFKKEWKKNRTHEKTQGRPTGLV